MTENERGNGGETIGKLKSDVEHNTKSIGDIWTVLQSYHREFHAGLDAMDKRRSDGDDKLSNEIEKIKTDVWMQKVSHGKLVAVLLTIQTIVLVAIKYFL